MDNVKITIPSGNGRSVNLISLQDENQIVVNIKDAQGKVIFKDLMTYAEFDSLLMTRAGGRG